MAQKEPKASEAVFGLRFAERALKVIAITTVIFIIAQYISFLITQIEQTEMIRWYFTAVVIEIAGMMAKRVTEVIVARVKKKEKLDIPKPGDTENHYDEGDVSG